MRLLRWLLPFVLWHGAASGQLAGQAPARYAIPDTLVICRRLVVGARADTVYALELCRPFRWWVQQFAAAPADTLRALLTRAFKRQGPP